MDNARRHIALLFCLSFLLVSLLSVVLIAEHADHDCHGAGCDICAVISHLGHTLKQLCLAVFASSMALAATYCLSILMPLRAIAIRKTLISLNVQLNN